jgi:hypothetical protein
MADAIQHNFQDPNKLTPTYALLSRIRLSSSGDVLASGERVLQHIIRTHSEPNLAPEEIQSRATKRLDSLREFSKFSVLSLKQCKTKCGNVSSEESRAGSVFGSVLEVISLVALNTFDQFVTH